MAKLEPRNNPKFDLTLSILYWMIWVFITSALGLQLSKWMGWVRIMEITCLTALLSFLVIVFLIYLTDLELIDGK